MSTVSMDAKPFIDYDGPTGPFVALEDHMARLESPEALAALGHSAMLIALGRNPEADQFAAGLHGQPTLSR